MPRKFRKLRAKAKEITPAKVKEEKAIKADCLLEGKPYIPFAFTQGNIYAPAQNDHATTKWTPELVQDLSAKLLKYAEQDDALVLMKFYGKHGLSYKVSYELEQVYPEWADAKNRAKTLIGSRREELALKGTLDAGMCRHTQATYDDDLRMQLQQRSNLAIGLSGDPQKVQINVINYGNHAT